MSKHTNDEFGNRMKLYESEATKQRLDVHKPIIARIDGRTFSTFTRGCDKPFDSRLSFAMRETAKWLVEQSHAKIGYVQSDEITLIFQADNPESSTLFEGRVQKLTSVLASMASSKFNTLFTHRNGALAVFDCRVWQVPIETEAANTVLWRAQDARKNAISAACRSFYSTKQMFGWGQAQMKEKIKEASGHTFEDLYPADDRHGVFFARRKAVVTAEFNGLLCERSKVTKIDMPFFGLVSNREGVIFRGETPRFQVELETA